MDAELLKEVNKVMYFIDEHKKGRAGCFPQWFANRYFNQIMDFIK